RRKPIGAKLGTGLALFPLLLTAGWEKVPEGRMRAGAPSAPVSQQSRCCPTARFARGPHPALRATFSHAARGRRGKLQFAALNLAPMTLVLVFSIGPTLAAYAGEITSAYTSFDLDKCEQVEPPDDEIFEGSWICK